MRGEVIAGEAEGADPDLGSEVDDREGVEDGAAVAASEGSVGEGWGGGREGLERGVEGGDGDDGVGGVVFRARDDVPGHPNAVLGLEVEEFCHGLGRRERERGVFSYQTSGVS